MTTVYPEAMLRAHGGQIDPGKVHYLGAEEGQASAPNTTTDVRKIDCPVCVRCLYFATLRASPPTD